MEIIKESWKSAVGVVNRIRVIGEGPYMYVYWILLWCEVDHILLHDSTERAMQYVFLGILVMFIM